MATGRFNQADTEDVAAPGPIDRSDDPVVVALRTVLSLAGAQPAQPNSLFVSSVKAAISARLDQMERPGDAAMASGPSRLMPWQERRAKEFLARGVGEDVSITAAATACKLSRSYFTRAFKQTTGETPHRWLSRHRIERAKRLLLGSLPIAEIAMECGFADQSHLTRAFTRMTGLPPGGWRRAHRDAIAPGEEGRIDDRHPDWARGTGLRSVGPPRSSAVPSESFVKNS